VLSAFKNWTRDKLPPDFVATVRNFRGTKYNPELTSTGAPVLARHPFDHKRRICAASGGGTAMRQASLLLVMVSLIPPLICTKAYSAEPRPLLPGVTAERLASGLVISLDDSDGDVGRHALSALARMAATEADGYRYGRLVAERILSIERVKEAARRHLLRHFKTGHVRYALLAQNLPLLADLLGETIPAPSNQADASLVTIDTALRSMNSPSPRAQRRLLERLTEPLNPRAGELAETVLRNPALLETIRDEVLAPLRLGADLREVKARFALLYAGATGAAVPDAVLRDALRPMDSGTTTPALRNLLAQDDERIRKLVAEGGPIPEPLLRIALRRTDDRLAAAALRNLRAKDDEIVRRFATELENLAQRRDRDIEIWSKAWSLLVRLSPERAGEPVADRSKGADFWSSDHGLFLMSAIVVHPVAAKAARENLAEETLESIVTSDDCRSMAVDAGLRAAEPTEPVEGTEVVSDLVIAASKAGLNCDVAALGARLDGFISIAIEHSKLTEDDVRTAFSQLPSNMPEGLKTGTELVEQMSTLLKTMPRLLAILGAQPRPVVQWIVTPPPPQVAKRRGLDPRGLDPITALIRALPDDHPIQFELRRFFTEIGEEALLQRLQQPDEAFSRTLERVMALVARSVSWSPAEIARILQIESLTRDANVRRATLDVLVAIGEPAPLFRIADKAAQGPSVDDKLRALKSLRWAFQRSPIGAEVYTPARLEWLAMMMEDYPERVVAALIGRPEELQVRSNRLPERLRSSLGRAQRDGTQPFVCLAYATLGPFTESDLGIQIIAQSQVDGAARLSSAMAAVCALWLAPARNALLTADGAVLTALARGSEVHAATMPTVERLDSLDRLWEAAKIRDSSGLALVPIANMVAATAPNLSYMPSTLTPLSLWARRLMDHGGLSNQHRDLAWELNKRKTALAVAAVPASIAIHLALWAVIIVAYPRSTTVQAHILHNRLARRLIGLGYMDLILTWVPRLRRTMFAPFAYGLMGDMGRLAPGEAGTAYFPESEVEELTHGDLSRQIAAAERAALSRNAGSSQLVSKVLADWRGPTLLIGPSGRGKTSYLRHLLFDFAQMTAAKITRHKGPVRFPFVYLRAADCDRGVLAAVCSRLGAFGRDADLLAGLLRSGRFDLYIDGLNEVERRTQDLILGFVAEHPRANVFIATQEIGANLPTTLAPFFLLPLTHDQMRRFLVSREPTLGPDAPVRGELFRERAEAFLDDLSAAAEHASDETAQPNRQPGLAASFLATLANPMDLDTAAGLIADGLEPDAYRLQEQQHRLVAKDFKRDTARDFPLRNFARNALNARKAGSPEIVLPSESTELLVLVRRKQVRLVTVGADGGEAASEYVFRHDKIRDFYVHFALLGDDPVERFELAEDERFFGVFEYLANALSPGAARELRDYLVSTAVDRKDHRLSDRFITHLRWRRLVEESDPDWLANYDTSQTREMFAAFDALELERARLEGRMRAARAEIEAARTVTRVLVAADDATLEKFVVALLVGAGATVVQSSDTDAPQLMTPSHRRFTVVAAAGTRLSVASGRQIVGLRLARVVGPVLLVVNTEPQEAPALRDRSPIQALEVAYGDGTTVVLDASAFLERLTAARTAAAMDLFWSTLESDWTRGRTAA
jgi:hypothetical protein